MCIYSEKEIKDIVIPIAKQYGIDKVYLFGSYARGEASEESDVDLYIEISKPLGMKYCSFFSEIEKGLDKNIDIITKDALFNPVTLNINKGLIESINRERKCIYEQQGY